MQAATFSYFELRNEVQRGNDVSIDPVEQEGQRGVVPLLIGTEEAPVLWCGAETGEEEEGTDRGRGGGGGSMQ